MAQRSTITLNDVAASSHAFVPALSSGDLIKWIDDEGSAFIAGRNSLTLQQKVPSATSEVFKYTIKLEMPILETIVSGTPTGYEPKPKVAMTPFFMVTFVCPERMDSSNRGDLLKFCQELLADDMVIDLVSNGITTW